MSTKVTKERIKAAMAERFAPLNNLDPQKLVSQLDTWRAGYLSQAARTWDAMLRRDDRLASLSNKRISSVARYGWDVLCDEQNEDAKRHKEAIEYFLTNLTATNTMDEDECGGMALLVRQMASAIAMRYAVHEIVWQPSNEGLTAHLRFVPSWFFENRTGKLRFLKTNGLDGVDMSDDEWLVTVGAGLMEASSVMWMYKRLSLRDWLSYSQKFGLPGVLGKTTAAQGSPQWKAMEDAVEAFCNDYAAVCNESDKIELIEAKGGSDAPFLPLVLEMNKAMAILWRGGDLGTQSGQGAENGVTVQTSETDLIEQDDVAWISETLQTKLIRKVIEWYFGEGVQPLAYVQIRCRDLQDTRLDLQVAETAQRLGIELSKAQWREKLGLDEPRDEEDTIAGSTPQQPDEEAAGVARRAALANEEDIDEEAAKAQAEALRGILGDILGTTKPNKKLVEFFETIFTASYLAGLAEEDEEETVSETPTEEPKKS